MAVLQLDAPPSAKGGSLLSLSGMTERWLAAAFVLYGLVAVAFLAINMPPFQNPDEPAHFLRAAQIADGGLLATRFAVPAANGEQQLTGGGRADPVIAAVSAPFDPLKFHPEVHANRAQWQTQVHWSAERQMTGFPNTAMYPPFFYVPSAVGILIGRFARCSVLHTLIFSRVLTGVASVAVGAAAVFMGGGAAPWLFAVLTLPMSLSLIASSSQDGLLLGFSALSAALMVRLMHSRAQASAKVVVALGLLLGLVATARPPYCALALLPLALSGIEWRWRLMSAAAAVALPVAWMAIVMWTAATNVGRDVMGADPSAQLARLIGNPLLVLDVARETLPRYWVEYSREFIGKLGFLDTDLPVIYRTAAWAILGVAAIATLLGSAGGRRISPGGRIGIAGGVLLSAAGVFAAEYLTWSPPGAATVLGVEGRYFLPLALAAVGLFPAAGARKLSGLRGALVLVVIAFPVLTLSVVMRAVVLRYYLG